MYQYEHEKQGLWSSIPLFIRIILCIVVGVPILFFTGIMLYLLPKVVTDGFLIIASMILVFLRTK